MIDLFQNPALLTLLEEFARGGGGGSGGGGGGGSGGGGGGSAIFMIGYLPTHFVTQAVYKRVSARMAYVLGTLTGIAVTAGMAYFSGGLAIIVCIGAAVGVYSGTHNLLNRIAKKMKLSRKTVDVAAQSDPAWNMQYLEAQVRGTFPKFQQDWSAFDLESIRTYTSPRYFEHNRLLLSALHGLGRQNVVANPHVNDWGIVDAHNDDNDDLDGFTAYIKAGATDSLVSMADNRVIYTDLSVFEEYWRFDRDGDRWVLDGIRQATENPGLAEVALEKFAAINGMYYSPDMGYLLLPERGQLFGKANFKRSDINNHVIGEWEGLLVQLYTYIPYKSRERADNFLVGQIALPKSYGGIIIKRRGGLFDWSTGGKGYRQVTLEWPDFNKRYKVFATDMDKVTSFELLNPAFMAELYDMNLPINIEVVDNVVYFYCRIAGEVFRYEDMLKVLQRSHKELKR